MPQVASVDGSLTEVVDTSCGKSVIAAGDTIYELSGVDFGSRSLDVLSMDADDSCLDLLSGTPSDADCYRYAPACTALHACGAARSRARARSLPFMALTDECFFFSTHGGWL